MTSVLLKQSGVPTPETWVCESRAEAESLVARGLSLGRRLVMKPLFGSQGIGVALIDSPASVPDVAGFGAVYYLQRYVESRHDDAWRDWRVLVVANRAIAVMQRRSPHWITTNRARSGERGGPRPAVVRARRAGGARRRHRLRRRGPLAGRRRAVAGDRDRRACRPGMGSKGFLASTSPSGSSITCSRASRVPPRSRRSPDGKHARRIAGPRGGARELPAGRIGIPSPAT